MLPFKMYPKRDAGLILSLCCLYFSFVQVALGKSRSSVRDIHALRTIGDCRLNSNTDLYSSSSGPIFCISQQSLTLEYNSTAGKTSRKSVVRWLDEVYNCFKVRFTNPIEFSQSLKYKFFLRSFTLNAFSLPPSMLALTLFLALG